MKPIRKKTRLSRVQLVPLVVAALPLMASPASAARSAGEIGPTVTLPDGGVSLETITVKGEAVPRGNIPSTVNVVEAAQFEERVLLRTEDILLEVPGVDIGNYSQGGVANVIRMRGFASGAHGGDLAVYVDGIPLNEGESHADGYADINVLIPLEIDRLEVYKGPSSVLFGNFARAGVLAFYTKQRGEYRQLRAGYGSFDTWDLQGAFGATLAEGLYNNTALQAARTGGFQDNSGWSRLNGATRFTWDVNDDLDLGLGFRAHDSDWDAPGYIPQAMFDAESRRQAPNAEDDGGDKTFYTQRFDLGWSADERLRILYWAYATQHDFTRFAKFGYAPGGQTERRYDRRVWGSGASLNLDTDLAGSPLSGVLGIEYYNEDTDWLRWDTANRHRLAQTQDREFNINTLSVFGEAQWEYSRWFRPTLGLRYDSFGGDYRNRDPGAEPFDSDMNDYAHWSPKLGFRSRLLPALDLRASYSEGFALPDGEGKYQVDLDVSPEVIEQYEVGFNYEPGPGLWVDVAGFILDSSDEIQEFPVGSGLFENLGKTRRTGMEAEARAYPIPGLELFASFTLIETEILDSNDSALEGKEIAGVPGHLLNLGLEYETPQGIGGRVKWRQVGEYFVDALNTETYEGYDVVDLGLHYRHRLGNGGSVRIGFDVLNVFDEWYSQSVFSGFGTTNYAVSWPRTYWLSVLTDW